MHGLPPTPKQVSDFLADDQTGKWERLIAQVLASPHYGERIAVNWLDLIRFSETDGFEVNAERQGAWRYRDWVIEAFNRDMPYDEFVKKTIRQAAISWIPSAALILLPDLTTLLLSKIKRDKQTMFKTKLQTYSMQRGRHSSG